MMAYFTGDKLNAHYIAIRSYSDGSLRISNISNTRETSEDYSSINKVFNKKKSDKVFGKGTMIRGHEIKRK
jgi:hypothetical protein